MKRFYLVEIHWTGDRDHFAGRVSDWIYGTRDTVIGPAFRRLVGVEKRGQVSVRVR